MTKKIYVERFGDHYLTVFNDGQNRRTAVITLDGLESSSSSRDLVSGRPVSWKDGRTQHNTRWRRCYVHRAVKGDGILARSRRERGEQKSLFLSALCVSARDLSRAVCYSALDLQVVD